MCTGVWANPQQAHVVHGSAQLHSVDPLTVHIETSDQAIIHWKDFSIGEKELTRFIQPHLNSVVLNRVTGIEVSKILGTLQANGRVVLINPRGIVIGKEGVIQTGGFIASTLDLTDEQFLHCQEWTFQGDSKVLIKNQGTIQADQGDIALFSFKIENEGEIKAPEGSVLLGAGEKILLQPLNGQDKFFIAYSISSSDSSEKEGTGIDHKGFIVSAQAKLEADGHLYALAINQAGIVQTTALVNQNGHLRLVAKGGEVDISGQLIAGSETQVGGAISVFAETIHLTPQAVVDASGDFGGGNILLGNKENPTYPESAYVWIEKGAMTCADANLQGEGGEIIIWGDKGAAFFNHLSARGGIQGGNGGFIEVSSPQHVRIGGTVDTTALFGKTGTFLIDPSNITISNSSSFLIESSLNTTTNTRTIVGIQDISFSVLKNTDLVNFLSSANVVIDSRQGGTLSADGMIIIDAPIDYNSPHALTFKAADTIEINSFIKNSSTTQGLIQFEAEGSVELKDTWVQTFGTDGIKVIAKEDIEMESTINLGEPGLSFRAPNGPLFISAGDDFQITHKDGLANIATVEAGGNLIIHAGDSIELVTGDSGKTLLTSTGGNIEIIAGDDFEWIIGSHSAENGIRTSGTSAGNITILAGDQIQIHVDSTNSNIAAGTIHAQGHLVIGAGTNLSIVPSPAASGGNSVVVTAVRSIFGSAGESIFLGDELSVSIDDMTNPTGNVTFVVDTNNPTAPKIGQGKLQIGSQVSLSSGSKGKILLFTARRNQNTIAGSLNGNSFVASKASTFGIDTSQEIFGVYYPSTLGSFPFTIFYKASINGIKQQEINQFAIASTEGPVKMNALGQVTPQTVDIVETDGTTTDPMSLLPNHTLYQAHYPLRPLVIKVDDYYLNPKTRR